MNLNNIEIKKNDFKILKFPKFQQQKTNHFSIDLKIFLGFRDFQFNSFNCICHLNMNFHQQQQQQQKLLQSCHITKTLNDDWWCFFPDFLVCFWRIRPKKNFAKKTGNSSANGNDINIFFLSLTRTSKNIINNNSSLCCPCRHRRR